MGKSSGTALTVTYHKLRKGVTVFEYKNSSRLFKKVQKYEDRTNLERTK